MRNLVLCLAFVVACGGGNRAPSPSASPPRREGPIPAAVDDHPPICLDTEAKGDALMTDEYGHQLLRGDCTRPRDAKLLVSSPNARFSTGIWTPDRKGFLYEDTGGIWEVDLGTGSTRVVYATPAAKGLFVSNPEGGESERPCSYLPAPSHWPKIPSGTSIDRLVALMDEGKTLVLHRGPYLCAGPSEHEVRVTDYRDATRARAHVTRPVHGIAALGSTLFMLDGGGLWRSDDGRKWTFVRTQGLPAKGRPSQLATLPDNRLLILTTEGVFAAGALYSSNDRGVHWRRLATPADAELPANRPPDGIDPPGVDFVDTRALGVLVVGSGRTPDKRMISPDDRETTEQHAWASRDGGASWTPITSTAPHRPFTARVGTDVFEATADGVVRIRGGLREVVTPELVRPYGRDLFGGVG